MVNYVTAVVKKPSSVNYNKEYKKPVYTREEKNLNNAKASARNKLKTEQARLYRQEHGLEKKKKAAK